MEDLITFIKNTSGIAYIDENGAVVDGSFAVTPYLTSGLIGNGEVQTIVNYFAINIFFTSKIELLSTTQSLWVAMLKNKYFSDSPEYTYEKDAGFWRATIRVRQMEV